MERGKLSAEYRHASSAEGGPPVPRGPYFKLQGREHGEHFTRRVSAAEVELLKEHISNFERFTELTEEVIDASVVQGRALRAGLGKSGAQTEPESKKNSLKKPGRSSKARRKPS